MSRRAQRTIDLAALAGGHLPGFEPRHGNRPRPVVESRDSNGFRYDDEGERVLIGAGVTVADCPRHVIGAPNAQPTGRTATGIAQAKPKKSG